MENDDSFNLESEKDLEFDFNEFLNKYQTNSPLILNCYFKDIYRELSIDNEGIKFDNFREYINLPKFISKHLFRVLSDSKDRILSKNFLIKMNHLYEGEFFQLTKYIFNFLDFDNDGKIHYNDVKQMLILSLNSENQNDSIFNYIEKNLFTFFGDLEIMDLEKFEYLTENYNSDIFLNLITYLYENKPYTNEVINYYLSDKRLANSDIIKINKSSEVIKVLRSKSIEETFKSISLKRQSIPEINKNSKSEYKLFSNLSLEDKDIDKIKVESKRGSERALIKSPNNNMHLKVENLDKWRKVATYTHMKNIIEEEDVDEDMEFPTDELEDYEYINVPEFPKIKNMFFPIEKFSSRSNISPKNNVIMLDSKQFCLSDIDRKISEIKKIDKKENYQIGINVIQNENILKRSQTKPLRRNNLNLYNISDDPLLDGESKSQKESKSYFNLEKKLTYESYINKYDIKKEKIIKYYIVLNQKMMLYFKDDKKDKYRGLHYLSDIYTEVIYNKKENFLMKGEKYYFLILKLKDKDKYFISKSEFEIRKWCELFRKTINPHKSRNLKEHYLLKESLSEGKYGLVKRAINIKTKQVVSIKIIGRKNLIDDVKLKEVKQEIEILMHCNHCGIVKFIDYFEENNKEKNMNNIYIVMEHLSGGDLASHIIKNGPLPEKKVISISWIIAKSLQYLHKLGIVHRDIKPENIVMDSKNNPKIVDFGLSKVITHNEYLKESYGTFYYASPEIHKKNKYNKSTDIWSFGVLMFYILTGDFPFSKNKNKALSSITDLSNEFDFDNYDFLSSSEELRNLIKKCLTKNYKDRIDINQIINDPVFDKYNIK